MKPTIYLCAWAIVYLGNLGAALAAQEPVKADGHVLVLDNERTLEGDVFCQGDRYVIRQASGEMQVPANKALAVCASLQDAYKFLGSRTNLRDGNERLKLARWCQAHGLLELAIVEAKASLALRPGHAESKQLLAMLERLSTAAASPRPEEAAPTVPAPQLDITSECQALFVTKVQPILMNTCASCHATGQGGSVFTLTRTNEAGSRRILQQNLSAAIKQINFEQPAGSPLLYKASCAHGGASNAALPSRQATPFVTLQTFVQMVVEQNPQLRAHGTTATTAVPESTPRYPGPANTAAAPPQDTPAFRPVQINPAATQTPVLDGAATSLARPVEIVSSPTLLPGTNIPGTPQPRQLEFRPSVTPPVAVSTPAVESSDPYDPRPFNDQVTRKQ